MKTAHITGYGGAEVFAIDELQPPAPSPEEALVAVVASTINPVDVKTRTPGTIQQVTEFPATLGWDVAGIVVTAPAGSTWKPGDRVIAMNPPARGAGSWSDLVSIPGALLAPAPLTVDLNTAACLPLAGLTARQALARLAPQTGERVLVTGAAGNVGGIAVQLLVAVGIEVHGLVSREEHLEAVRELGAADAATDAGALSTFDAVFDTAGIYETHLVRPGGRLVTVSDDDFPDALLARTARAEHHYVGHDPGGLRELTRLVDTGRLTLRVAARYPLTEIRAAHEYVERGGHRGKVLLQL